jgi:hypothetical protein
MRTHYVSGNFDLNNEHYGPYNRFLIMLHCGNRSRIWKSGWHWAKKADFLFLPKILRFLISKM